MEFKLEFVINVIGLWVDEFVGDVSGWNLGVKFLRFKGIYIVMCVFIDCYVFFISGEYEYFFVMLWWGYLLIGIMDIVYIGFLDDVYVMWDDIDRFIGIINVGLLYINLMMKDVFYVYVGICLFIGDEEVFGDDLYMVSWKFEIMDYVD